MIDINTKFKANIENLQDYVNFANANEFVIISCGEEDGVELLGFKEVTKTPEQLLVELKAWFSDYYTIHEQKYRRLNTLKILTDDGKDPYQELLALYSEAEVKRARIQELEAQIQSLSKSKS